MPDIIVTTPRDEKENPRIEGEVAGPWFKSFRRKPDVKIGDFIWITERGKLVGRGEIVSVTTIDEPIVCPTTGRKSGGDYILEYDRWTWANRNVKITGVRGFRYVNRIPGLRAKLSRATRGG